MPKTTAPLWPVWSIVGLGEGWFETDIPGYYSIHTIHIHVTTRAFGALFVGDIKKEAQEGA